MPKGPKVTDAIEALIAQIHQKHRKWKAVEVQREVSSILRKKNRQLPKGFPSLSAVQKVLAKIRKKNTLPPDPKDKPFSLGALVEHHIPPEALPMVLRVWASCNGEKDGFTWSSGFSIRDALWVSRFSHLYDEIEDLKARAEAILGAAVLHSVREQSYEAIGKMEEIDTTDLDEGLLENFRPTKSKRKQKEAK